jgi:hypothetical protein
LTEERKSYFLKKRSKKLLPVGVRGKGPSTPSSKSFLILFFKKELLSFLP